MLKICATIVLYNPDKRIFDNIDSYINYIDTLIVVDNSEISNKNLIGELNERYKKLIVITNKANLGIATALNIACDKALELSFDWILTMDQDSKFLNFSDYIGCLLKVCNQNNLAILAPNTQWHFEENLPKDKDICKFEEKFIVITSGNLINLKLFNTIGRFEDKLFIDMVDHDYCMKTHLNGYKIYFFENIMLQHSLGTLFQRKNIFTKKVRNKIEHNPQRVYYITRNFFYTWKMYSKDFPKEFNLLKTINILFIHEMTKILIYEDQKLKKIGAKFLGLYHFFIGKYGKYDI